MRRVLKIVLLLASATAVAQETFRPVSPVELALKDNPKQPGASIMILELSEFHDDTKGIDTHYERIKVFDVQDKSIADVEVPNIKNLWTLQEIDARTIHADGTIVPFTGEPYERVIAQVRGARVTKKMFTFPDVQRGSILEYEIKMKYPEALACWTTWYLQRASWVQKETFTLQTKERLRCASRRYDVPENAQIDTSKPSIFSLELHEVAPFENEPYSPPASVITSRIEFFNNTFGFTDSEAYWNNFSSRTTAMMEEFIGNRKTIHEAAASIVSASDAPLVKLHKIRDRIQTMRNTSWETPKTQQEEKREKLKDNNNIEDVWKHQYGSHLQVAALYVGLVRAAGVEANLVSMSSRKQVFFNRDIPDSNQLSAVAVVAHIDGKPVYLDPITPFCPFGMLPWEETGVIGIELVPSHEDKKAVFVFRKAVFVTTPPSDSKQAVIHRRADLHLDGEVFKGTVELTFDGLEAMRWREEDRTVDEGQQYTRYEGKLKVLLPPGAMVHVTKISHATDTDQPLTVDFDVEIPGLTSTAGKRVLLPASVFHANDVDAFTHEHRVHPMYFSYPYQELDDVWWTVPLDFKVEFLPARHEQRSPFGYFDMAAVGDDNVIHTQRRFALFGIYFPATSYPALREFFQKVHAGDQETMALQSIAPPGLTTRK